ncbi:putative two-component sensor histidine kinase [Nonlabens dokdonensis DSW-6]|uniref:histidine kinase n=2 Tax=Nonlabens dokdonensis TaxID=328515 RepID=L7WFK5_NONDD|nr:putative two-component sensor histidine kinase [Nonlabens dokdonensis DSW-6]
MLSRKRITLSDLEVRDTKIKAQEDVLTATLETQEKERRRIARDLHDEISSKLNVISLNTDMLINESLDEKDTTLLLSRIKNATERTSENARRIAHDLLPPVLEKFGLCQALTELVGSINNEQLEINFRCNWDESNMSLENQLHTYRVAQELFNNSIKYSKADKIDLLLDDEPHRQMIYRDNGIGFQETKSVGLGTSNINSRISILQGTMTLKTANNQGVLYTFDF